VTGKQWAEVSRRAAASVSRVSTKDYFYSYSLPPCQLCLLSVILCVAAVAEVRTSLTLSLSHTVCHSAQYCAARSYTLRILPARAKPAQYLRTYKTIILVLGHYTSQIQIH